MSIIPIKINTSLSLKKLFRSPLLPVFSFLISLLALSLSAFYLSHQSPAFATPPPPPTPITLSASISHPVVTLNFKAGDLATSAFKQFRITYDQTTNNPTGATSYISSIDEETSLTHNLATIPQKIETISSELSETNFTLNHWGYRSNQVPGGTNVNFKPVPKASSPDLVISTQDTSNARAHIDFGARLNLSLPAGTYSKNILLTAITNHVPKTSKFLPGPDFHDSIKDLVQTIKGSGQQIHLFKHADSPPGAVNPLKTVSTLDSERPIYMWYDASSQAIYWHSDADVSYMNENGSYMFRTGDIPGLGGVDLDLRSINTSRTTDMSYMFQNAKAGGSLASINTSEFNTSRVKNMSHMFEGTEGITSLDLSSFNTSEVEDMSYMFRHYYSPGTSIENFDLSNFNTSKVKNMSHMFEDNRIKHFNLSNFDTKNVLDMSHMFSYAQAVAQLDLSSFNTEKVTNMSYMFESTLSLQNLNLSNFNTGNVTDMSYMFRGTYLPQLDLSSFDTKKVIDMSSMFDGAFYLTNLNISSFDTAQVTNMTRMFAALRAITSLNLSNFNTENVTDMSYMFCNTDSLLDLDLSSFRTPKVQNMYAMFMGTKHLKTLNISNFDTTNVTNMSHMFHEANSIETLDLSHFNTSNVESMISMFQGTWALKNLNISNFNTSRVSYMNNMFFYSFMQSSDSVLDISSFDTRYISFMDNLFSYSLVKTIYVSNKFGTNSVSPTKQLFFNNTNLVGGNGTTFDPAHVTKEYARIDAPGTPGYFTLKP